VDEARKAGIDNISLDLMVGLEKQNRQSLAKSIEFCSELSIPHISAYLLKLEEGTPFYNNRNKMLLPDDDFSAELYEFMCGELVRCGYEQYEISNFAKDGKYSRHNIKYWKCEEYLGIGASAHGFFNGKRYYYQRSVENFINDPFKTVSDGFGGGADEFFMLGLRLKSGIDLQFFSAKFKLEITQSFYKKVDLFEKMGYLESCGARINLTSKGFLVSNAIIGDLLSELGI
jgi:oxygen-independent coproporphyrinogen-3 oxidase